MPSASTIKKSAKTIVKPIEWWKDKVFTDELDEEFVAWKSGKEKGFSSTEIDEAVMQLKVKRRSR